MLTPVLSDGMLPQTGAAAEVLHNGHEAPPPQPHRQDSFCQV